MEQKELREIFYIQLDDFNIKVQESPHLRSKRGKKKKGSKSYKKVQRRLRLA